MWVSSTYVSVSSAEDKAIPSQTNLIWTEGTRTEANVFEVLFLATVPATGLTVYKIK